MVKPEHDLQYEHKDTVEVAMQRIGCCGGIPEQEVGDVAAVSNPRSTAQHAHAGATQSFAHVG
jgi:hypothetical protein